MFNDGVVKGERIEWDVLILFIVENEMLICLYVMLFLLNYWV